MDTSTAVTNSQDAHQSLQIPLVMEVIGILVLIESILVILANPITLLAIVRSKLVQKSSAHFFIGALCVTDFLGGLDFFLMQVIGLIIKTKGITPALIELNWLICVLGALAVPASLINSFLIGVDRYIAVSYPTQYMQKMRSRTAALMVLGQWVFVSLVVLPACIYKRSTQERLELVIRSPDIYPEGYTTYLTTPLAFILIIANALLYARIFWRHKIQTHKVACTSGQEQAIKRSRRLTRMSLIVVSILMACWTPVCVVSALPVSEGSPFAPTAYNIVYNSCFVLVVFPAYMNNVIYAWQHKDYRAAYLKLIGKKPNQESSVTEK